MRRQQTLSRPFTLRGIALHSGEPSVLTVEPAPAGSGLVFVRDDLGGAEIPALQQNRAPMVHATKLKCGEAEIDTPEHLLAALFAFGVDNATMRTSSREIPILDGSALPFVHAISESGVSSQAAERATLTVTKPIVVSDEDRSLEIHPYDGFRVTAGIDFEHRRLGYQQLTVRLDQIDDFLRKLAPARTFALKRDVDTLRAKGMVRGGSLDNAVVIDDDGVMGGPLRFEDEFVRHKLLDLVGDLALAGCDIRGRVVAWRAGHALHGRLVDAILSDESAWVFEGGGDGPDRPAARAAPPGEVKIG